MKYFVSPYELHDYLKRDLQQALNRTIFIWGQPGIGKTVIVHEVAQELKFNIVPLEVSTIHPYALSGVPVPIMKKSTVELMPLSFIRKIPEDAPCILFLDDFGAADPYQQRIALSITTYRSIGDYFLPDKCHIIIATNREEDAAYVITPSYAILNRAKHYKINPKIEDWLKWMLSNYPELNGCIQLVFGFLANEPKYFCWSPEEAIKHRTPAYPTPRSWTNFILDIKNLSFPDEDLARLCAFWTGDETATAFAKYILVPDKEIENILSDPRTIRDIPKVRQLLVVQKILGQLRQEKIKVDIVEAILNLVDNDIKVAMTSFLSELGEKEEIRRLCVKTAVEITDKFHRSLKKKRQRGVEGNQSGEGE